MDEISSLLPFEGRKADRSYRLCRKRGLTSVIFLSLLHFSRLSSRMAGKQGRMQSLPFKLRFPVHEERRADRSIAMLRPSRMDRNDNDTLGEFRVQLGNTRLSCWQTFVSLVDESYSNIEFLLRIKDKKIKGINLTYW